MAEPPNDPPADQSIYEARLEAVLESVTDAFYAVDADWRMVVFNRAAERYFGAPKEDVIGRGIWELFPQGVGTPFEASCHKAMEQGVTSTLELPSRLRPDRVVELRIAPMRGGGISVSLTDITERRRAEDAVKAALARSEAILESISDAFYAVDGEWRFTYVNRVAEAWWGRSREELIGRDIWEAFPQSRDTPTHEAHLTAARERRVVRAELISPILGRWVDLSIFPTDSGLSVYFRDITERKQAEQRQQLLVHELNHRVKNALATVQAIAAQSLRGDDVPDGALARFNERLMALAQANDVLVAENWEGASLATIAARVARPYAGPQDGERFRIEGPVVRLSPPAATAMALALHELATNAAKYGALSMPEGQIALTWTLPWQDGEQRFVLTWRESGGPAVSPPKRTGFGSRLIGRGLAAELGGVVALDYAPTGLVLTLTAPLGEALAPP